MLVVLAVLAVLALDKVFLGRFLSTIHFLAESYFLSHGTDLNGLLRVIILTTRLVLRAVTMVCFGSLPLPIHLRVVEAQELLGMVQCG